MSTCRFAHYREDSNSVRPITFHNRYRYKALAIVTAEWSGNINGVQDLGFAVN